MKNVLLDTHVALWAFENEKALTTKAKEAISNLDRKVYVSIATLWEVAIKMGLGKLAFEGELNGFIGAVQKNDFEILEITTAHVRAVKGLPNIHKDPFDRMLIAQALVEDMILITADKNILKYDIESIW